MAAPPMLVRLQLVIAISLQIIGPDALITIASSATLKLQFDTLTFEQPSILNPSLLFDRIRFSNLAASTTTSLHANKLQFQFPDSLKKTSLISTLLQLAKRNKNGRRFSG